MLASKKIIELSKISPVLVVSDKEVDFKGSTILPSKIPSKNLGVVNTATGLKCPAWFFDILKGKASHQIVIKDIDLISFYSQQKFCELLKYKTISTIELPSDCNIIVTAKDIKKVAPIILSLCQVVK